VFFVMGETKRGLNCILRLRRVVFVKGRNFLVCVGCPPHYIDVSVVLLSKYDIQIFSVLPHVCGVERSWVLRAAR
jgi:hypothetical protein